MPSVLKKILTAFIFLSFLPVLTYGQTNLNFASTMSDELAIEMIPTYPRPNENVYINLAMYTADLNSAEIFWYKDGKLELSGKGEVRYSFKTGAAGKETNIEIRVVLQEGQSFNRQVKVTPASVDLVWEANSYTPPFYKGKAMHGRQGLLKIVAMPNFIKNGSVIDPKTLIYEWSNGLNAYQSQSGYGKNILLINGSVLGQEDRIELLVRDPASNMVTNGFLTISPIDPELVFYEKNPFYGYIFEKSLGSNVTMKGEELEVWTAPYNLSNENSRNLRYEWRLNGSVAPELSNSRSAVFRRPEEGSGNSSVSLKIENLNRILQYVENTLMIKFEE